MIQLVKTCLIVLDEALEFHLAKKQVGTGVWLGEYETFSYIYVENMVYSNIRIK